MNDDEPKPTMLGDRVTAYWLETFGRESVELRAYRAPNGDTLVEIVDTGVTQREYRIGKLAA